MNVKGTDNGVRETRLPDVTGWAWENTYPEFPGTYRHEITWSRHAPARFLYSTLAPNPGCTWSHVAVADGVMEKLGADGTLQGARIAVARFIAGEES